MDVSDSDAIYEFDETFRETDEEDFELAENKNSEDYLELAASQYSDSTEPDEIKNEKEQWEVKSKGIKDESKFDNHCNEPKNEPNLEKEIRSKIKNQPTNEPKNPTKTRSKPKSQPSNLPKPNFNPVYTLSFELFTKPGSSKNSAILFYYIFNATADTPSAKKYDTLNVIATEDWIPVLKSKKFRNFVLADFFKLRFFPEPTILGIHFIQSVWKIRADVQIIISWKNNTGI